MLSALFALVIFGIGSHFLPRLAWTTILLVLPVWLIVMCHHTQFIYLFVYFYWLRWGFANFFPGLDLNHNPPNLCLLCSLSYCVPLPWPSSCCIWTSFPCFIAYWWCDWVETTF
jgi:hypothetical protein